MKKTLSKKKISLLILAIITLDLVLSFGIYSFSKYTSATSKKELIIPLSFVFDSNYLKTNNPSYDVYGWNDGITIELYNNVGLNKSELDVPYKLTVTNGSYTITDGSNNVVCPNNVCTLLTSKEKHVINVTPANIANPIIVNVSSSAYNYNLNATFNLINKGNYSYYSFTDNNDYYELVINTSGNDINSLIVNWDADYSPDNNNPLMENWIGNTGTLSLSKNTEYSFIFFKNTNNVHSNIPNMIIQNNTITLP